MDVVSCVASIYPPVMHNFGRVMHTFLRVIHLDLKVIHTDLGFIHIFEKKRPTITPHGGYGHPRGKTTKPNYTVLFKQ